MFQIDIVCNFYIKHFYTILFKKYSWILKTYEWIVWKILIHFYFPWVQLSHKNSFHNLIVRKHFHNSSLLLLSISSCLFAHICIASFLLMELNLFSRIILELMKKKREKIELNSGLSDFTTNLITLSYFYLYDFCNLVHPLIVKAMTSGKLKSSYVSCTKISNNIILKFNVIIMVNTY